MNNQSKYENKYGAKVIFYIHSIIKEALLNIVITITGPLFSSFGNPKQKVQLVKCSTLRHYLFPIVELVQQHWHSYVFPHMSCDYYCKSFHYALQNINTQNFLW